MLCIQISLRSISICTSQMSLEWQVVIVFLFTRWETATTAKPKRICMRLAVQLAVTVWYLASGTDFTTLSHLFGIDKCTVSKCVWDYTQTKKVD